jgi:hypothetical protein
MSDDELDTLPEWQRFGVELAGDDASGRPMLRPIEHVLRGWSLPPAGDPLLAIDREGRGWTFVRLHGRLHKVRASHLDVYSRDA